MQPVRRSIDPNSDFYNVFNVPIPTTGNPTEVLANRFQGMTSFSFMMTEITTNICDSLAQDSQRPDSLLRGNPSVLPRSLQGDHAIVEHH